MTADDAVARLKDLHLSGAEHCAALQELKKLSVDERTPHVEVMVRRLDSDDFRVREAVLDALEGIEPAHVVARAPLILAFTSHSSGMVSRFVERFVPAANQVALVEQLRTMVDDKDQKLLFRLGQCSEHAKLLAKAVACDTSLVDEAHTDGTCVIEHAHFECRRAMSAVLNVLGRYKLDDEPRHTSATSVVFAATDAQCQSASSEPPLATTYRSRSANSTKLPRCALKAMRESAQVRPVRSHSAVNQPWVRTRVPTKSALSYPSRRRNARCLRS